MPIWIIASSSGLIYACSNEQREVWKMRRIVKLQRKNTTFWRKICCSCFPNLLHLRIYIFTAFQSWIRGFLFIKVPSFLCIFLATISCEKTTIANLFWNNKADKEYFLFIATSDILPVFIKIRIELMSSHFIPLVYLACKFIHSIWCTFEIRIRESERHWKSADDNLFSLRNSFIFSIHLFLLCNHILSRPTWHLSYIFPDTFS